MGVLGLGRRMRRMRLVSCFFHSWLDAMLIKLFEDMRKPLSRDPLRRSVRANGRDYIVSRHDVS